MRRTIKIAPKKSVIKGSLKADYALFDERVGAPVFVPQNRLDGNIFAVNQYTHLDSDGITYKPVILIDNVVEVLHKTKLIISIQVINPEDYIDPFNVQNIRYRWFKNGSYLYEVNNLNDYKGSSAIQFTEDQCTPAVSGIYTVEVTNDSGTTTSGELVLRVHDPLNTPELYGNLIFNSSGEADLDGWNPSPGIAVHQFHDNMHDYSFGENASIPRIERLRLDHAKSEDEETKAKPIQPIETFSFKKHIPYVFKDYYEHLRTFVVSNGGTDNFSKTNWNAILSPYEKWAHRYKWPNLVPNENAGVVWGPPSDFFGSFYPSKNYLDEYNDNVQSSITAEGSLPGWQSSINTFFGREPMKPNEDSVLTMTQQIDVSNINGFIDGNVCGVDKVVGNLFAYVGTGIDSYNYRVVFDDLHKIIPTNEQLLREIISSINTWDADLRYAVEGFTTPWSVRGSRNPIPNIYKAPTLRQRSSYMEKIHPTIFDNVGGRQFTINTQGISARMNYRSGSTPLINFFGPNSLNFGTGVVPSEVFSVPQFIGNSFYTGSNRNVTTQTQTFTAVYSSTNTLFNASRSTLHLTQDFGYLDDDWDYTSGPFVHQKDTNGTSAGGTLSYYQGRINKGITSSYQGPWNWFGPPIVTKGTTTISGSYAPFVSPSFTAAVPSNIPITSSAYSYLASSYTITARYLNSLSILTGGRENDFQLYTTQSAGTRILTRIPETSVLNFTNLRYKTPTPLSYTASVPLGIENFDSRFTAPLIKQSYWRDFNPSTHTVSSNIEENRGLYSYTQKPDVEHPEGHKTEESMLSFLRDRTILTLGFNCDYFAKAAALVPSVAFGTNANQMDYDEGSWVENGFYVEKTVGEFDYQPPQWKYPILKKLYETSIGDDFEYSSYLSDFAVIFNRLLMIQNINQAHPDYDIDSNPYPVKGAIQEDLYLDAISRTMNTAGIAITNPNARTIIEFNQYRNIPFKFRLASPSLYYQDKYVSYIHRVEGAQGLPGGRNTCYAPYDPDSGLPSLYSLRQVSSRESLTLQFPETLPDITPLPTSGEEFQPFIDKTIAGLNTRFEDAEDFIMNYIIKPLNDDLFRIPDIENLTEDQLNQSTTQVFMSAVHLFSANRTHLAGGFIEPVPGVLGAERIRQGFQEGDQNIDTSDNLRWYHRQIGSPHSYGAVDTNFSKPVTETNISNSKLFASVSEGPLSLFYINQLVRNEETDQIQNTIDAVDTSTFDEKTGQRRQDDQVAYRAYAPSTHPTEDSSSAAGFSANITLSVPTGSFQGFTFLGVPAPTSNLGSPGYNLSIPQSAAPTSVLAFGIVGTANLRASRFPFYPSLDYRNKIKTYTSTGFSSLRAPLLTYSPVVPTAEVKSALYKTFRMRHSTSALWSDNSLEQEWHEYIRKALVYWLYVYRGGLFEQSSIETLLMPSAPDIELNTLMLSGEALLHLQKDVTAYPLQEYRHILSGVHNNVSYQGARIEMTPRADNQVKFKVSYLDENQEVIGQDTLEGPTIDDIFAVKEKMFLPSILGSLIQKTCILPDTNPVPVLYKNIELFSVTNTEILSPTTTFLEKYGVEGTLASQGISSGDIVGEVINATPEDYDNQEWKDTYEIISKINPDRGAAAFFAVNKKLFLPKGTVTLDVQIAFENNSISRNAPPITQGPLKYEADTIPAMHTTYPYALYEYGYPRTGVCLVKLSLYDNEFKRTKKYPQYYIPATHVWSSMKQTMQTYGPLAYLQGYSILGRYGQSPGVFEEINYRVPDRTDLATLQQGQRLIRTFVLTQEMRELFANNGYMVDGEPPTTIRKIGVSNEIYNLYTVEGIQSVMSLYNALVTLQTQNGALTNDNTNTLPNYQN